MLPFSQPRYAKSMLSCESNLGAQGVRVKSRKAQEAPSCRKEAISRARRGQQDRRSGGGGLLRRSLVSPPHDTESTSDGRGRERDDDDQRAAAERRGPETQAAAAGNGRSLEGEARRILSRAVEDDMAEKREAFRALAARLRGRTEGRAPMPSEVLIREDRDGGRRVG